MRILIFLGIVIGLIAMMIGIPRIFQDWSWGEIIHLGSAIVFSIAGLWLAIEWEITPNIDMAVLIKAIFGVFAIIAAIICAILWYTFIRAHM